MATAGTRTPSEEAAKAMAADPNAISAISAAVAQALKGNSSSLKDISSFSGSPEEVATFIREIELARDTFKWSDENTAIMAQRKFKGAAANWIDPIIKNSPSSRFLKSWDTTMNGLGLKDEIVRRFNSLAQSNVGALFADAKQKPDETVSDFYDRVGRLLSVKFADTSKADKNTRDFQKHLRQDYLMWFSAGLNEEIRNPIFASPTPPQDIDALLEAARNVETENQKRRLFSVQTIQSTNADVNVIYNQRGYRGGRGYYQNNQYRGNYRGNNRGRYVNYNRGRGGTRGRGNLSQCYGCGGYGHTRPQCGTPPHLQKPNSNKVSTTAAVAQNSDRAQPVNEIGTWNFAERNQGNEQEES